MIGGLAGSTNIGKTVLILVGQWRIMGRIQHYCGCVVRGLPAGNRFKGTYIYMIKGSWLGGRGSSRLGVWASKPANELPLIK